MSETLLLNWVYYPPVGHAVEALKVAKGFAAANLDLEIELLLNSRTPYELSDGCKWIRRAHAIDIDEIAAHGPESSCLRPIAREWTYIVNDHRPTASPVGYPEHLMAFHRVAEQYFQATAWRGGQHVLPAGEPLKYQQNAPIRIQPPNTAYASLPPLADNRFRISLLLAGSSNEAIYPRLSWWSELLSALHYRWPEAEICITGKSRPDERSSTIAYFAPELATLFAQHPYVIDCYDIGLWPQIALLDTSKVFVSPHTGFGFLAPSVGTPWVTVSGGRWPECFFNNVPFFSALPNCPFYPCWQKMRPECEDRLLSSDPVLCMNEELRPKTSEILEGITRVLDPAFTFEIAREHYEQQTRKLPENRFFEIR